MNRYLFFNMPQDSNFIDEKVTWIEKVIQTCENKNHLEACEKLVTNFTNYLLFNQDFNSYHRIEKFLRKLIQKKNTEF